MLSPVASVQMAMESYQSLPPEGVAEVTMAALSAAGYVIVPKDYLRELITTSATVMGGAR